MKSLVTALAVTAILATSAIAKTERTKTARPHPNNSVFHTSATQLNGSYCHFRHREAEPDHRVWLQLVRDCQHWESDE
jgi:hypothetical protein